MTGRADGSDRVARGDFVYLNERPLVVTQSAGVDLIDVSGDRYLDGEAANGSAGLGYDRTILTDAVAALDGLSGAPSFVETDLRLRVAARLADRIEQAIGLRGRVAFDLGGAQGIELALKIAWSAGARGALCTFEGAYHGRSLFTCQLSASRRYRDAGPPVGAQVVRLPYPSCADCRFGQDRASCAHECAAFVKTSLGQPFAGLAAPEGQAISAFVFEPVLNVGGMVEPDPGYLHGAVNAVRAQGGLIIADEVFTGFHRTGPFLGCQRAGVQPDVIVLSKALTNGLTPLSCVWAREELINPGVFRPGTHSVTFANNPLALAVCEQVLNRFDAWDGRAARVSALERRLGAIAAGAAARFPFIRGSVIGPVLRLQLDGVSARQCRAALQDAGRPRTVHGYSGLIAASTGAADNVLLFHPALTTGDSELDAMEALLHAGLEAVAADGVRLEPAGAS